MVELVKPERMKRVPVKGMWSQTSRRVMFLLLITMMMGREEEKDKKDVRRTKTTAVIKQESQSPSFFSLKSSLPPSPSP